MDLFSGMGRITIERQHQLGKYAVDSDLTRHNAGDLAAAAECYLRDARYQLTGAGSMDRPPARWPFDDDDWSTASAIEQLTKAAALCAAEIDRHLAMMGIASDEPRYS